MASTVAAWWRKPVAPRGRAAAQNPNPEPPVTLKFLRWSKIEPLGQFYK
jgi:hypothetical protein